jgi:hypothetical protein
MRKEMEQSVIASSCQTVGACLTAYGGQINALEHYGLTLWMGSLAVLRLPASSRAILGVTSSGRELLAALSAGQLLVVSAAAPCPHIAAVTKALPNV